MRMDRVSLSCKFYTEKFYRLILVVADKRKSPIIIFQLNLILEKTKEMLLTLLI